MNAEDSQLGELLKFLERLREAQIHFTLAAHREEAVMVQIAVPGERWEVEFMADGAVEVERFRSDGTMGGRAELEVLFRDFSE